MINEDSPPIEGDNLMRSLLARRDQAAWDRFAAAALHGGILASQIMGVEQFSPRAAALFAQECADEMMKVRARRSWSPDEK